MASHSAPDICVLMLTQKYSPLTYELHYYPSALTNPTCAFWLFSYLLFFPFKGHHSKTTGTWDSCWIIIVGMLMLVTQPWGNIMAIVFFFSKGHIKRRPDKVCLTLHCPFEKGHSQIWSETVSVCSSYAQISETSLWNNFPLRNITCSTLPSYACETASCARKIVTCHWKSNQISAERTTPLILSNKWKQHKTLTCWIKVTLRHSCLALVHLSSVSVKCYW